MIKRTHTCGELNLDQLDSKVSINGWISKIRDLGGLIFIDLRDRYGITQIFFNEKTNQDIFNIVKKLGLKKRINHYPHELSGGERQRVSIARAIITSPDIILADEPTGNLDPVTSFELIKLLEEINREGTSILMASHNYNLIKGRGHRIIEIQNGIVRKS